MSSNTTLTPTGLTFLPTQISGLSVWVDANDQSKFTLTGGTSNVVTLTDKASGGSYTVGGTPTWASNAFPTAQGRALPGFNMSNGRFISAVLSPGFTTFTGTYFLVTQLLATPTVQGAMACAVAQSNTGSTQFYRPFDWVTANFRSVAFGGSAIIVCLMNTPVINTPILLTNSFSNAANPFNNWLYMTGTNSNFTPTSNTPGYTVNGSYFMIGTDGAVGQTTTNYWPGVVSEVIAYNSVLSSTDRQNVEGYLASKWGFTGMLPATHTYRSNPIPALPAPWNPYTAMPSTFMFATFTSPPVLMGATYIAPPVMGARSFSPLSISNALVWFDAADTATITGTSPVTAWANKGSIVMSASNRTGTCTSGNTYTNGLNYIRCPAGTDLGFTCTLNTQARTWFIVARNLTQLNVSPVNYWGPINATTGTQDGFVFYRPNATNYDFYNGPNGVDVLIDAQTTTNPLNTLGIYCLVNSTTAASNVGTLNGSNCTLVRSVAASGFLTTSSTYPINTSAYNTGGDYMDILFYSFALSPLQRQTVEGYLAWKWGLQTSLPATHPFAKFPPPP